MSTIEIILVILWYITGVSISLYIIKTTFKKVTVKDLVTSLLIGGILGFTMILVGLMLGDYGDKKLF